MLTMMKGQMEAGEEGIGNQEGGGGGGAGEPDCFAS